MDLRDFEIVLALTRQPFASHETLGRSIGLSGNAVNARVDRMEKAGLLKGFHVMPRAALFGRHWHVFAYSMAKVEPDLPEILTVPDVVNVWRGRPRTIMVNTFARTRGTLPPEGLTKVMGQPPVSVVHPDPPSGAGTVDGTLSPLDWRVLDALLDRPRAPLTELAESAGLSTRTVRKRRDSLLANGSIGVIANFDTSGEPGLIVFSGHIVTRRREDLDRIHAPGLYVIHQLYGPPAAWALGHAGSYAELQEVELALRSIPGVVSVELVPSRGGAFATGRLREWIGEELHRWETLRRKPKDTRTAKPSKAGED